MFPLHRRFKQPLILAVGILVLIGVASIPFVQGVLIRNLGWLSLQRALYQQEDPANSSHLRLAGEQFSRALYLNPSDSLAADGLGLVYLQYGDPERAVELFERVSDESPWSDVARMHRLFAQTSTMDIDRQKVVGGLARSWCDPIGLERQIHAFSQEQLCDLAGEWSTWSVSRCDLAPEVEAQLGRIVGSCYVVIGDWEVGLAHLERAARLMPDDARIQLALGEAWLVGNERTQALQAFQRALQLNPDSSEALSRIRELESD
jgi:tetratricopeptide (TPR) repeat protein